MPVSQVIGFIKGKSAIHLARVYGENRRNFVGQSFRARGYFVSTVGRDEEVIRNYIRNPAHKTALVKAYVASTKGHADAAFPPRLCA
jgi:putative transposase